jgi:hypothetical protein
MPNPAAKPAKAKKPPKSKITVRPTIREVTEIRFCETSSIGSVNFDNPEQIDYGEGEYFVGKVNQKNEIEITAPCSDSFTFTKDTIKELVKLLGI